MKNAAKVFAMAAIGFLGLTSYGQFGVKGGLGVSSWTLKDRDVNAGQELFNAGFSFHAGMGFEIVLSDNISLEPALMFTQKGFSAELDEFLKLKLISVEMPVNVKVYVIDLGDTARLYALGGGYVGFIVGGKSNGIKLDIGGKSTDDFKALDGGFNIGAGVQLFDALSVDVSGSIGVANLSNDQTNGLVSKVNVVRLTATYQFGG